MPHFEMPDAAYVKKEKRTSKEELEEINAGRVWTIGEIESLLLKKYEGDVIGKGSECIVVPIEGEEKKIAAYSYSRELSPSQAKRIFYLQRIFSTLFPHNFPHFYASVGSLSRSEGEEGVTGTIRHKIDGIATKEAIKRHPSLDKNLPFLEKARANLRRALPPHFPFSEVLRACKKEMGFDLHHDSSTVNFLLGSDGGEYYVDTLKEVPSQFMLAPILAYMDKHTYSEEEKRIVTVSFERFEVVDTQWRTELKASFQKKRGQ
jgi:hypothetical protein